MLAADVAHLAPPAHVVHAQQAARTWRTIVVRPGDTIWDLAIAHGTTPGALVARNRLAAGGAVIHPGQRLLVPGTASPSSSRSSSPATAPRSPSPQVNSRTTTGRVHVVRPGDTMTDIAARYGTTLTKLLAANRLRDPGRIYPGQRISLPGAAVPAAPKSTSKPTPTSENTFAGYTYSDATVAAAKRNRAALAKARVPNRTEIAAMIRRTAIRHGVDPKLALAIAWQESGWNQRAVSVANAIGTMQVIPMSGDWASQLAGRRLDLLDAQDNITAGVVIIRALRTSADSLEHAIAGYYQGLHSVRTKGLFKDTEQYVAAVLAHMKRL
ncbi:LysM peptidoglycan-binding domain-containing protein [Intrasporangium sp.]|uniref:LysM peptidoglycan-binding domain-containing protein n=1 Tax=Intrasporangium sp. TaxID=1925024 RepID=UPI002939F5C7|nr:LysM peptidoglycan-binding domain-containing protein [Intrasporangium sp.]MDV3221575.1 LysM peptidoglycan-binding domain-containing protein [Intrasporangium sp.]